MEVKEAIEFCKSELYYDLKNFLPDYQLEYNNKMRESISLLQQGEKDSKELVIIKEELKKVWQMWEEFCLNEGDLVKVVNCIKHRYEQKYFPKEADHEYPEGEE